MRYVGQQARDGVGVGRVVVATDGSTPIDQNHSSAVNRTGRPSLFRRELEPISRQPVDCILISGQEVPAARLRIELGSIISQYRRRVMLRIDTERDQLSHRYPGAVFAVRPSGC
jgi:hypothetical protein